MRFRTFPDMTLNEVNIGEHEEVVYGPGNTEGASTFRKHVCSGCNKLFQEVLQMCEGCQRHNAIGCSVNIGRYCSQRCQKRDWKSGHREICRARSQEHPLSTSGIFSHTMPKLVVDQVWEDCELTTRDHLASRIRKSPGMRRAIRRAHKRDLILSVQSDGAPFVICEDVFIFIDGEEVAVQNLHPEQGMFAQHVKHSGYKLWVSSK